MADIEKYKKTIAQLYANLENEKKLRKDEQQLLAEEKKMGKEQE
jgi:hypothetical protein